MGETTIRHTREGTLIFDSALAAAVEPSWFDEQHWRRAGAIALETTGRGSVLVVDHGAQTWVLRHYRRGGLVSKLIEDHYVWLGLERTRAFREWRLLKRLRAAGLPVPNPIAARVKRVGLSYTADVITGYLPDTRKLSAFLADGSVPSGCWARVGRMVRSIHAHGVDHPDLTAHNILLDSTGTVFLVDFDNAAIKPPGRWRRAGIERLKRSLRKVALETGTEFDPIAWAELEAAYTEATPPTAGPPQSAGGLGR
jgi:3-deoxy-D-manno-octulosonic acid kinase